MLWALTDNQGSVRDVVDGEGNVVNHITYDSFGQITAETNPDVDFRFTYTGREFDSETGQYYYRARYYDSTTGQFISQDPIGFNAGDSNLYRYVNNSPLNYTDPTGEFANLLIGAGAGAAIDLAFQLVQNKGDFSQVDWTSVATSALSGALGGALSAGLVAQGAKLLERLVINAIGSGLIDAGLQYGKNVLEGNCDKSEDVLEKGLTGALGGAAGEAGEAGLKEIAKKLSDVFKQFDEIVKGLDIASDTIGDLDWLGRPISQRTQNILDQFDDAKRVAVETPNGTVNVEILENLTSNIRIKDLGKLQAATGQEYILLRGPKGDRVLIRGDVNQNAIPEKYLKDGYKWSGHSHPYNNTPSSSDRSVLREFGQDKSVIIDMQGRSALFGQNEDLSNWLP